MVSFVCLRTADLVADLHGSLPRDVPLAFGFALLSFIIRPLLLDSSQLGAIMGEHVPFYFRPAPGEVVMKQPGEMAAKFSPGENRYWCSGTSARKD